MVGLILLYKNRNLSIDFTNGVIFKAILEKFYPNFNFQPLFYLKIWKKLFFDPQVAKIVKTRGLPTFAPENLFVAQ